MTTVTHAFVSAIADSGDSTEVRPTDWNASHIVTGGAGIGGPLATKSYRPGSNSNIGSTTSNTMSDVDATNLVVTFTVPASGKVLVRLTGLFETDGSNLTRWGIREGSTTIAEGIIGIGAVQSDSTREGAFIVTGLTPDASKTYKWGFRVEGSTPSRIVGGPTFGEAVMEVWDAESGIGGGGGRGEYVNKYNPDNETPATTPEIAAEFNGALDSGWAFGAAFSAAADFTTYPGYMYVEHGVSTGGRLAKAWAPAGDATLACKVAVQYPSNNGTTHAYLVGLSDTDSATPTNFNGIYILGYSGTWRIATITRTGGNWTVGTENILAPNGSGQGALYYRLEYVASTGVGSVYYSVDGMTWTFIASATRSLTTAYALVLADASAAFDASWDWIRGWAGIIKKVGE